MKLSSLFYDLLMDGMSKRELVLYIILVYVALRFIFIYIARKYLTKQLPIKSDNAQEEKIQNFYVKALDMPILIYILFVIFSITSEYFGVNFIMWYVGLLASVIIIEIVTGVARRNYVKRIKRERKRVAEQEKAEQQQST